MLRFLWMADPPKADSEIIQFQFARLVFGLRPSLAILGALIPYTQCSNCKIVLRYTIQSGGLCS